MIHLVFEVLQSNDGLVAKRAPPSPGVVEAARSALSTAEWHIAARMIELGDARQPSGEAAAALNKVRDAIRELSTVQPTTGGGGDREAIARIIDPAKMEIYDREMAAARELEGDGPVAALRKDLRAEHLWLAERAGYDALAKADAIIALRPTPSGETDDRVAVWMMAHSYVTGHGDTVEDLLHELEAQARARASTEDGDKYFESFSALHRSLNALDPPLTGAQWKQITIALMDVAAKYGIAT